MDSYVYAAGTLSVEEYLRVEEASPERHEYVAGEAFAMVGGTARHSQICGSIFSALRAAAGDGPCRVFYGDLKLRAADDRIYYPDVMSVCVPVPAEAMVVTEPRLLVEVTSRSTRRVDRVEKLFACQQIPSLQAYLIVEQRARAVDRWWRDEGGAWRHETVTDDTGGRIPIPGPDTVLTLDAIYHGVTLGDGES